MTIRVMMEVQFPK